MVKKVFAVLVVALACIVVGGLVLGVFMPNAVTQFVNAVEDTIYKGTGLSFDINGDGNAGDTSSNYSANYQSGGKERKEVPGF